MTQWMVEAIVACGLLGVVSWAGPLNVLNGSVQLDSRRDNSKGLLYVLRLREVSAPGGLCAQVHMEEVYSTPCDRHVVSPRSLCWLRGRCDNSGWLALRMQRELPVSKRGMTTMPLEMLSRAMPSVTSTGLLGHLQFSTGTCAHKIIVPTS
jgi:hypothetical protein